MGKLLRLCKRDNRSFNRPLHMHGSWRRVGCADNLAIAATRDDDDSSDGLAAWLDIGLIPA